ncbi:MAG: hypothetical protein IPJ40_10085 [Saprospirales bacterium]|nr:hypothetical protein [Saprospirales bacterium]
MQKIILTVTNDLTYDQRMHRICDSLVKAGYDVELVGRLRAQSRPLAARAFHQTRLYCRFEKGKPSIWNTKSACFSTCCNPAFRRCAPSTSTPSCLYG